MTRLRREPDDGPEAVSVVGRIRAGDVRAFEHLYLTYFDELWRFAYRFVRTHDGAEDVVQDVFVSLWRHRERLGIQSTVRGYLYGSVRKHALSEHRHEAIAAKAIDTASGLNDTLGVGSNPLSPDDQLIVAEESIALQNAVRLLPERQRMAFMLRWDGLSILEISETMDVSVVAVRKLLGKALRTLSDAIGSA